MEFETFRNPIKEARQGRIKQKPGVTTDMNAMVDIAFLLLTFFLLTTTMVRPKAIELVMPVSETDEGKKETQAVKESRAIVLIPLPGNKLAMYRGQSQAKADLISYGKEIRLHLKEFSSSVKNPIVLIKPHPDSAFENLIDLLDEVNISGVERYTIDNFSSSDELILKNSNLNW